jgi:hypothetical protein
LISDDGKLSAVSHGRRASDALEGPVEMGQGLETNFKTNLAGSVIEVR